MSESARDKAGWLLIVSVTAILAALAARLCPSTWTPIRAATAFGSGTALLFALLAIAWKGRSPSDERGSVGSPLGASPSHRRLANAAAIGAVWAGSLAGSLLVYLTVVRAVYAVIEVLRGGPIAHDPVFDSGWDVLIEIAALIAACLVGLHATQRRTLIPIMFWLAVLGVIWTTLQWPIYSPSELGTFARSAVAVLTLIGLSATVSVFVGLESIGRLRRRWRAARTNPDALLEAQPDWPGMRPSVGAVAIALILLVCFTLTAPPTETLMAPWLAALVTAACALAAGSFCFVLVGRRWSVNLSDAALGLITLSFASLAIACVPSDEIGLSERYPMVFTAVIIALALSCWFWVWLARVWRQQLDGGQPWTTAGRLVPVCEAFSFFAACIGLVLAWLMAIWPKLRGVGVSDDSPGRMTAGVAALLYLLLVMLWNGRVLKRPSFHLLAALATAALVCFIVVRAAPFVSATVAATIAAPASAGPW